MTTLDPNVQERFREVEKKVTHVLIHFNNNKFTELPAAYNVETRISCMEISEIRLKTKKIVCHFRILYWEYESPHWTQILYFGYAPILFMHCWFLTARFNKGQFQFRCDIMHYFTGFLVWDANSARERHRFSEIFFCQDKRIGTPRAALQHDLQLYFLIHNHHTSMLFQTGFLPNVFKVLAYRPAELRAFLGYYDVLMDKNYGKTHR